MATTAPAQPSLGWRTPALIIACGCLMAILTFGPRSVMGFFLQPMTQELGFGRDVFSLALAIQNLLWGAALPFVGAIADRYGTAVPLAVGGIVYAAGLALMAYSTSPAMLHLSSGVLVGFGLAGASFTLVLAAFGKLLPEQWRGFAFGLGTASGSFGQFLFSPLAVGLLKEIGWHNTLLTFAVMVLLVLPLAFVVATPPMDMGTGAVRKQSFREALGEAFGHTSYILLVLGFFTCGFHIAFITVHLPPYLVDRGLDVSWGGWVLAFIGLFNIIGAISSGLLGSRFPKRYLLSIIYTLRAIAIAGFVLAPMSPASALAFGAAMGVLWLSTVPLTSQLVALMFGPRFMATLFGFVFFSHQVGAFIGVWLGGYLYERTGSYDVVWWLAVALGIFAALVNLPIREQPVARLAPAPA
ncbi:MAG: MFS transporter [Alphaproteobacteria bacterium]|nr:MAG: MFS transporter [Alphaproteobacteria bacterium]